MVEIKEANKKSIWSTLFKNTDDMYLILSYTAGILLSAMIYSGFSEKTTNAIKSIVEINLPDLKYIFFNYLCSYICVYTITLLLGICLIGFPFTYIIPFVIGFEIGLKLCYYYTTYNIKGIGYSLILIIPEIVAFLTILIKTISISSELSKLIYKISTKKSDMIEEINLKSYLKFFLIFGAETTLISIINSIVYYFFSSIISI